MAYLDKVADQMGVWIFRDGIIARGLCARIWIRDYDDNYWGSWHIWIRLPTKWVFGFAEIGQLHAVPGFRPLCTVWAVSAILCTTWSIVTRTLHAEETCRDARAWAEATEKVGLGHGPTHMGRGPVCRGRGC